MLRLPLLGLFQTRLAMVVGQLLSLVVWQLLSLIQHPQCLPLGWMKARG